MGGLGRRRRLSEVRGRQELVGTRGHKRQEQEKSVLGAEKQQSNQHGGGKKNEGLPIEI